MELPIMLPLSWADTHLTWRHNNNIVVSVEMVGSGLLRLTYIKPWFPPPNWDAFSGAMRVCYVNLIAMRQVLKRSLWVGKMPLSHCVC